MTIDALREALSATREAWQAVDDEFPSDDSDLKAAALLALDNALCELEQALRIVGVSPDE
jgi:myo-inositol catabolism protein IolC